MSKLSLSEAAAGPTLSNGTIMVSVDLAAGTLTFAQAAGGRAVLASAATAIDFTDGETLSSRRTGFRLAGSEPVEEAHGRGLALRLRLAAGGVAALDLTVTLYEEQPFAVLRSTYRDTSGQPRRVQAFRVLEGGRLRLGADARPWRFYKQGWQSWSPTLVLPCAGEDIPTGPPVAGPGTQPPAAAGRFLSELVTAIVAPGSSRAINAGFISAADQFSQLWLDRGSRSLTAVSYADGIEVAPGDALSSEALLVDITSEPLAGLQTYGDALAREMGATPWPRPLAGWCSWYYYWQGVSEADVLANLGYLAENRDELPLEYVQLDDGYQTGIGDWLTVNEKFPHGLRWLAERIHERGFKAGLWLAPFLIGAGSRLYAEHPEWAVQYRTGRPCVAMVNWGQACFALDCTRPEAIEWLSEVFRTVSNDWGFDYVKIDFTYAAAVDGLRHDTNVTRAQAYRRGLEAVRRAMGDKFILGCGNPIGPSVGLIDGARIGPDVAPIWTPPQRLREPGRSDLSVPGSLNAIRNTLSRFWMHGRLWLNDPDCLLARDSETALTADEVRTLATVIALCGGMALDSDNLARLTPERRALISFLLPPLGRPAVPLDLFAEEMPRLFALDCGMHRLLGVFNWDDEPREIHAPLPEQPAHAFEAWSKAYLGVHQGQISVRIPAHGCALLALRSALDRPQLVGSTFHVGQGVLEVASESFAGDTLVLSLKPVAAKEGTLYLHLPPSFRQAPPRVEGADADAAPGDAGLLAIHLALREPRQLRIRLG